MSKYETFRRIKSLKRKYSENYNLAFHVLQFCELLDLWTLFLFSFFDYVPHRILILQELKTFQYHIVYIRERDGASRIAVGIFDFSNLEFSRTLWSQHRECTSIYKIKRIERNSLKDSPRTLWKADRAPSAWCPSASRSRTRCAPETGEKENDNWVN